jgi:hypothetical protein
MFFGIFYAIFMEKITRFSNFTATPPSSGLHRLRSYIEEAVGRKNNLAFSQCQISTAEGPKVIYDLTFLVSSTVSVIS